MAISDPFIVGDVKMKCMPLDSQCHINLEEGRVQNVLTRQSKYVFNILFYINK